MNAMMQMPPQPIAVPRVGLTERQHDCFLVIQQHIHNFRHAPTSREIARIMGLKSPGRVHHLLVALQERGWITFLPCKPRSIALVPRPVPEAFFKLPPDVEAKLLKHCCATGEDPADVLTDAVALFLDEAEGSVAA
jgi:SOS-response transcriptional repressor LexA